MSELGNKIIKTLVELLGHQNGVEYECERVTDDADKENKSTKEQTA